MNRYTPEYELEDESDLSYAINRRIETVLDNQANREAALAAVLREHKDVLKALSDN